MRSEPASIFLVEDNPWDVWLIEETLRRRGLDFRLDHTSNVEEAARAIKNFGLQGSRVPDLILLDYNLPIGNGCDILNVLSEYPKLSGIPKAMITTFLTPAERERAFALGACCCIAKPSSLHRFFTDVGTQLAELLSSSGVAGTRVQAT